MSITAASDESIIKALRSKSFKATPQRIAICRFALNNREHPSIQRIFDEVKKVHPTVSLATVYKTLKILKELCLIKELNFPNGQTRYDSYMEPHINLVCRKCGDVRDVEDREARERIMKVTEMASFRVVDPRLDIYGICKKCCSMAKP